MRSIRGCTSNLLLTIILGMTVLLHPLKAQQKVKPKVFAAVAPEWPVTDSSKPEQPSEEIVAVKVMVDGFGNVVDAESLAPKSFYSDSAVRAARLWKFVQNKVTNINGTTATLKFSFRLLPSNSPAAELSTTFVPYNNEVQISRLIREH